MSPDRRTHRGAHPEDSRIFAPPCLPTLRRAMAELSHLLSWEYPMDASLKLVGDRYQLHERQRMLVRRSACSAQARQARKKKCLTAEMVTGRPIAIDGFNLIITIEAALGGGLVFHCPDGAIRDLSSIHGSYRSVQETDRALQLITQALLGCNPSSVLWLLDRPVSNSGRLRDRILSIAGEHQFPWTVELDNNPDRALSQSGGVVISSDMVILDACQSWINLAQQILPKIPQAWLLELDETE